MMQPNPNGGVNANAATWRCETTNMFEDNTVVIGCSHVTSCDVGDGVALLNLEAGVYFGINDVGARVWALMEKPVSFNAICSTIAEEFDVSYSVCRSDLSDLMISMMEHGLIEAIRE